MSKIPGQLTIKGKAVECRGLYWEELDDSSKANLKDAVALLDTINLDTLDQLMERRESQASGETTSTAKYGGMNVGTLLRCGVFSVDGDEVGVPEWVGKLSPRDAALVAQEVYELTEVPDQDGNLETK